MVKILVIEDDKLLTKVYKNFLEAEKYQVTTVAQGEQGLAKILEGGWNLILLDIMLPGKTGLEILQELQQKKPKTKNGPLIVLSNVFEEKVIKQAMRLGAVGYIVKDKIDPKGILSEVKSYLSQEHLY